MLILPFIHNVVTQNSIQVHTIKFLTIGGRQIWTEDNSLRLDEDILNSNDIYRKGSIIKFDKNLQICEVDMKKTRVTDFYKWEEVQIEDTETFCWRMYIHLTGNNGDNWLDVPEDEMLDKYSVKAIINTILQKK